MSKKLWTYAIISNEVEARDVDGSLPTEVFASREKAELALIDHVNGIVDEYTEGETDPEAIADLLENKISSDELEWQDTLGKFVHYRANETFYLYEVDVR